MTLTSNDERRKDLRVFALAFALFTVLCRPIASGGSDGSRLATVESLVERSTFSIDGSSIGTIDKFRYQNRFYSDKPPLLAVFAAGPYALVRAVGIGFSHSMSLAYAAVTILTIGALSAAGLVFLGRTLRRFHVEPRWAELVVLLCALGTLLLPYSVVFSNHAPAAALLMIGFHYLVRADEGVRPAFLAGLFTALAGAIDIAAFVFLPFFGLALLRRRFDRWLGFAVPALLVLGIYFWLNRVVSGSFAPPSMNMALWDYPGSAFNEASLTGLASQSQGFAQTARYAFHMLLGHRGLFSYTPVLVFSLIGAWRALSAKDFEARLELGLAVLASAIYVAAYTFRSVNYSGFAYGVRWYADLTLLASVPLAFVGRSVQESPRFRRWFLVAALASIFIAFVGTIKPFTPVKPEQPNPFVNCLMDPLQPVDRSPAEIRARNVRDGIILVLAVGACVVFRRRLLAFARDSQQADRLYTTPTAVQ
jgi:hypothetical protein